MEGNSKTPNKALHRTAIPLRSIAAGELGRYMKPYGRDLNETKEMQFIS